MLTLLAVIDAAWLWHLRIGFPHRFFSLILPCWALLTIVSAFYRHYRRDDVLWLMSEVANQCVVGSCVIATFNYLGLTLNYPLMDAQFMLFDGRMGLDWTAYIDWVENHPGVARIFTLSYIATGPEIPVILILLGLFRKFTSFHRFALGGLICAFMTVSIATFCPATAAYIFLQTDAAAYPHLHIHDASVYGAEFFAMRGRQLSALPEVFQGMVAFPSFHSALAVLAIVAARRMPSLILPAIIIAINILMIISTPVDGGHYFVDTLSGILAGIFAALLAAWLLPARPGTSGPLLQPRV